MRLKNARACCWTEDGEDICCLSAGHKGEHDFTSKCNHTEQPVGYREWHSWAKRMSKTHRQYQCPHCGLWAIWMERPKKSAKSAASTRRTTRASAKAASPTGNTRQDDHWSYITR